MEVSVLVSVDPVLTSPVNVKDVSPATVAPLVSPLLTLVKIKNKNNFLKFKFGILNSHLYRNIVEDADKTGEMCTAFPH